MLSNKALGAAKAVAQITYVGGTTAQIPPSLATTTNVSLTSLTGGAASQPSENDVVIVYYGTGAIASRAISVTTSGYTQVAKIYSSDTNGTNLYVGYKVMGATPDTQVTVSATGSSGDSGAVAIHVWRNVDTVLPLDKAAVTATGANSVLCNPPAITPNTSGAIIVAGGAGGHSAGTQTFSSSDLSNFCTISGNFSNDVTVGLGSYAWTSGAFDPAAFTFSTTDSTSYSWAAVTLALRPKYTGTLPTFVASASTQNSSTGASLVINKPTGTAQNDIMIAIMAAGNSGSSIWTGDTGWTEVADQSTGSSLRVAYKVAGASEGSSYTFTFALATQTLSGSILTYRSATYDTVGSPVSSFSNTGITVASDFSILISAWACTDASFTIGAPTGTTVRVTDSDATTPSYLIADEYVLSGATGTRAATGAATNRSSVLVSIKPS